MPINKKHFEDYEGGVHYKTDFVTLLLTEGHLIQFIEEKTNKEYKILNTINGYKIDFSFLKSKNVRYYLKTKYYNDLLKALWKAACKIAQEEINNQKQSIVPTNEYSYL